MVTIRLARGGRKKRPFFHIVVTDNRKSRDTGRPIECLGFYNPIAEGKEVALHIEEGRVTYWRSQGAQLSKRIRDLLKKAKIKAHSPKKADDQVIAA